jgi:DNA polymerase-3 subunit delta
MTDAMKPAYLIAGSDDGKIAAALGRLRARAERESGPAALQSFDSPDGQGAPDADALIAAFPAMSLLGGRRYLVADRIERWTKKQAEAVAERLADAGPDTTVVLVARERVPASLEKAVKARGGEVLSYDAPKARELPRWLTGEASARGFTLERDAARMLVERIGDRTARLGCELERLALWAGPGGTVTADDLSRMVADTSEQMIWALSDAVSERRKADAIVVAERLAAQGESVSHLVYTIAGRLRRGLVALRELESGRSPKEVERSLGISPYAAKMLIRSVRDATPAELRHAVGSIADLEWWTRGGSDYGETTALALAVGAAAGGFDDG